MNQEILWHALTAEETAEKLNSSRHSGLGRDEAQLRLSQYGLNTLPEPKRRTLFSIFFHQFLSPLIYLLLVAAGIAFFIGDSNDWLVILVVVILNAVVGTVQEGRAEQSLAALRRLAKLKARILRDKEEIIVEAAELVPGDILILSAGDAVPADSRIFDSASLAIAEAALTGESVPVTKLAESLSAKLALADRNNMAYMGTYVTSGRASAMVVATGVLTEIGKIAELATTTVQPKTQLEVRIDQFGRYLVFSALILFVLVLGLGIFREIPFVQIFMIAISQMVSLVPEGLPVAMTISLAVGVQRMAKRGTIVRRLSAVESLGSTTVICSDKTGTLTRNEMMVTSVYLPAHDQLFSVTGVGYKPEGDFLLDGDKISPKSDKNLIKIFEACSLCNDAQLIIPEDLTAPIKILGDPTEAALLTFSAKGGFDPEVVRKEFIRVAELPFSSEFKMMATQHNMLGKNIVFIKGAPESILDNCNSFYKDGNIYPYTKLEQTRVLQVAKEMAGSALRVLAFGFIDDAVIDAVADSENGFSTFSGKITLIGLVGELDPPRDEVAASIRECVAAGIKPVMVTGDHKATGLAIAKSLGISREQDLAIDGSELDELSDKELLDKIHQVSVFARVRPAQKLRIVEAYQALGEVVAMTGDGVNDAPALARANVGVAMGITGTEVAKEAAKIVITDDNFSTILAAISEGRLVYQNIKKLILFLFVTSVDEVLVLFLALVLGYPLPLAAVQILWINLVTEGILTINLIMDPPDGSEMRRPPIPPSQPLLDRALLSRIPLMALASVASTFGWFLYRTSMGVSHELVQTETFTVLAVCQWFNVLNCRSATESAFNRSIFKNYWLIGGLIIGNLLHLAVVYYRPLGQYFHTVPIDAAHFFEIGVVASLVLWAEELRKFFARRRSV